MFPPKFSICAMPTLYVLYYKFNLLHTVPPPPIKKSFLHLCCCVCDTLKTSREATNLILNQSVVEKPLPLLDSARSDIAANGFCAWWSIQTYLL